MFISLRYPPLFLTACYFLSGSGLTEVGEFAAGGDSEADVGELGGFEVAAEFVLSVDDFAEADEARADRAELRDRDAEAGLWLRHVVVE